MRSLHRGSLSVVAGCLFLVFLVHSSAGAPQTKASRRSKPAPRPAAAPSPEDATIDDKPIDDATKPQSGGEEPAALPEPETADDDVASPLGPETASDDPPQPQSEEAESTNSDSDAEDADKDDTESVNAAGDEGDAPPLPPGGGLLEKLKRAETPVDRPEPAEFHGIRVGQAKVADVEKAWGTALSVTRQKDIVRRVYRLDAAGRVEVLCGHNLVQSIVVHYDQHPRWSELAGPLGLEKIETVDVLDEFGEVVGVALPESGVLVAFRPGNSRRVAEIVYEPIDPQAFVLRAEHWLGRDYVACQRDLDLALVVDPKCARAIGCGPAPPGGGANRRGNQGRGGSCPTGAEERAVPADRQRAGGRGWSIRQGDRTDKKSRGPVHGDASVEGLRPESTGRAAVVRTDTRLQASSAAARRGD